MKKGFTDTRTTDKKKGYWKDKGSKDEDNVENFL